MDQALPALTAAERRVADALARHGLPGSVIVLDQLATTAQMAADALGVDVGRIVKSLVFKDAGTGDPLMLLVSGANRVHEKRAGREMGIRLARADAEQVRAATGFAIGGVSPFGHPSPIPVFIDDDLYAFTTVWAAAGNARSVFSITPADLERAIGARRIKIT